MKSIDIRSETAVKLLAEFLDMDVSYAQGEQATNAEHFAHGTRIRFIHWINGFLTESQQRFIRSFDPHSKIYLFTTQLFKYVSFLLDKLCFHRPSMMCHQPYRPLNTWIHVDGSIQTADVQGHALLETGTRGPAPDPGHVHGRGPCHGLRQADVIPLSTPTTVITTTIDSEVTAMKAVVGAHVVTGDLIVLRKRIALSSYLVRPAQGVKHQTRRPLR